MAGQKRFPGITEEQYEELIRRWKEVERCRRLLDFALEDARAYTLTVLSGQELQEKMEAIREDGYASDAEGYEF